jgi:hypothetical protein
MIAVNVHRRRMPTGDFATAKGIVMSEDGDDVADGAVPFEWVSGPTVPGDVESAPLRFPRTLRANSNLTDENGPNGVISLPRYVSHKLGSNATRRSSDLHCCGATLPARALTLARPRRFDCRATIENVVPPIALSFPSRWACTTALPWERILEYAHKPDYDASSP